MAQAIVQVKCPHCQNPLRVPAEWLTRQLRCKHCQKVFRGKPKASANGPALVAQASAKASPPPVKSGPAPSPPQVPQRPTSGNQPFDFDDDGPAPINPAPAPKTKKGRKNWVLGLGVGGGVLLVGIILLGVLGPRLGLFKPQEAKIVKGPDNLPVNPDVPNPEIPEPPPKKTPIRPSVVGPFPRRALLINVSNYLLANSLSYGSPRDKGYPGSSTSVLADALTRPPMNFIQNQITELADGSNSPHPAGVSKLSIEQAISSFTNSCRDQDRILLLFAGHVQEGEKEAFLVPIEGDLADEKTLIPLQWVYDQLAKCKARQKLLVLDICRYPPARGNARPGGAAMGEVLDKLLETPPPGLQVWSSCVKDQQSIEGEKGSLFLQAVCNTLQERLPGIAEPIDPFPMEALVPKVNQRLKELLGPLKLDQITRLTGQEAMGGPEYNPDEPLPAPLALKPPVPGGGKAAGLAVIKGILDEIYQIPMARPEPPLTPSSLPVLAAKDLDPYKSDGAGFKDPGMNPLRTAIVEAITALKVSEKIVLDETLPNPGGQSFDVKYKALIKTKQERLGMAIFELEQAWNKLQMAGENLEKETSKRWQAHYEYTTARMMSRLVFVSEYNFILAQIRSDSLPEIDPKIHTGWRIASRPKIQINESKLKDMVKAIGRTYKKISEEHPGTPWAILARREGMTALGLEWKPKRD